MPAGRRDAQHHARGDGAERPRKTPHAMEGGVADQHAEQQQHGDPQRKAERRYPHAEEPAVEQHGAQLGTLRVGGTAGMPVDEMRVDEKLQGQQPPGEQAGALFVQVGADRGKGQRERTRPVPVVHANDPVVGLAGRCHRMAGNSSGVTKSDPDAGIPLRL